MATKKTVKKGNTEPVSKATPKVAKPKKEKKAKIVPVNVRLVSLTVGAVIPTQQYGNIQPSITVEAATIEEARGIVMPVIEELIRTYAETKPGFLGRVEMVEKVVTPPASKPEVPSASAPASPSAPVTQAPKPPAEESAARKPESVQKAEKAISLSATKEAIDTIQNQIKNSVKIPAEFKDVLIELCYKKHNELNKSL